ncbi:MAG TPA: RHS repeat-associated core domain-containing protein [Chitinophagaceae bacterium]|nr:RHS repeat-associated core domain-containing protein [Chitinophagaceae bacterium]
MQHYSPFGLIMSGISSKANAFGGLENRKKFNGILYTSEFDLNTYDALFRNADPQIGKWWQIDPKPNHAESPYAVMGNNPILKNDPLGDTVRTQGFTQTEILNNLAKAIKLVDKQKNPFSFDKKGDLKYSKKDYKKLSSEQKEVAKNIVGTIGDSKVFTIIKGDKNTVIQTKSDGSKLTLGDNDGAVTVISDNKNAPNNVNIFIDPTANFNAPELGIKSTDPTKPLDSPAWLVMMHEWGGHGYLKYVKNDPNQLGNTIGYENKVRSLHEMGKRDYDDVHIKPDY